MTWKPDIVIYHHPCDDGFGAAWAAWMRWRDDVQYVPAAYGQPAPDVTGKDVLLGDFSYKRAVLEDMAERAASIVILDHHKTAQADLEPFALEPSNGFHLSADHVPDLLSAAAEQGLPPVLALFDMDRSGARMMWDFCHGDEPPELIQLIEDRDLWRFKLPDTKAFTMWLRSMPYDFEGWEAASQGLMDGRDRHQIMTEAAAMKHFYDQKVAEMAQLAYWTDIAGHSVPTVNCPGMFASDVGHELLDMFPAAPFVASFHIRDGRKGYSLRSQDHRHDVAAIAETFGGGGHRNAAGFGVLA